MGFFKEERRSSPLWSLHGLHTPWWRNLNQLSGADYE